jgi:CHRD domain-containing protein
MARRTKLIGILSAALLPMIASPGIADDRAHLSGYNETPLTISSTGSGEFRTRVNHDGTAIDYQLSYRDLESTVTQSHIHFGAPAITGGIVLFLCTNLNNAPATVPTPQACPAAPATITGTLTAADVIAVPGQGIDPGAVGFAEIVKAMRAGAATYVNVHTTGRPSGEIRAPLGD